MRIALGQINTTVGAFAANVDKMITFARRASELGADVIVFPELALTGYPPRDLVERPSFVEAAELHLAQLAEAISSLQIAGVCGTITRAERGAGKQIQNSAVVLHRGKILFRQDKMLLPTYDVFDEGRYFLPAEKQKLSALSGRKTALTICEDAWNDRRYWERRPVY